MSGTEKEGMTLSDVHAAYSVFPDPYKDPPICHFDHHALASYAEKNGKRVSDLTMEEKMQFLLP